MTSSYFPLNIQIYSLSSSILQDFCIAYSASNDNGSEAVSSCNSLLDIHLWYLFVNVLLALSCYEENQNSLFHVLFFIRNQYHTASNYFHIFVKSHFLFSSMIMAQMRLALVIRYLFKNCFGGPGGNCC